MTWVRTGIQLYTLRELEGGLPTLLRRVGETAFDGVEFVGSGKTSPREAAAILEEYGLKTAGLHDGIESLEADSDGVAETCVDGGHMRTEYQRIASQWTPVGREPVEDVALKCANGLTISE